MRNFLAIVNILGILALGTHDLLSHEAFAPESDAIHCSACDSCQDTGSKDNSGSEEQDSTCSTLCDCGCFHLSALGTMAFALPGIRKVSLHYHGPDYPYDYDFKFTLLEPPRIA